MALEAEARLYDDTGRSPRFDNRGATVDETISWRSVPEVGRAATRALVSHAAVEESSSTQGRRS
jgi:hypothetical protein